MRTLWFLAIVATTAGCQADRAIPDAKMTVTPSSPSPAPYLDESLVYRARTAQAGEPVRPESVGFSIANGLRPWLPVDLFRRSEVVPFQGRWALRRGSCVWERDMNGTYDFEPALTVQWLVPPLQHTVCQLEIDARLPWSFADKPIDHAAAPRLFNRDGGSFEAIGYVYADDARLAVRFTPDDPIRGLDELPKPLRRDAAFHTCRLLFCVPTGAIVTGLAVGDKLVIAWDPPITAFTQFPNQPPSVTPSATPGSAPPSTGGSRRAASPPTR